MNFYKSFWNSENVKEMYELDNAEVVTLQPFVAKYINELNPTTLLDYGCGDAPLIKLVKEEVIISLFDKNIENLKKIYNQITRKGCRMFETEKDIPTDYFDCIVLSLVLVCIDSKDEQKRILTNIKKWKKEEGSLLIVITHPCFSHYEFGHYYTSQNENNFNYFTEGVPYTVYMKRENKKPLEFVDYFWTLSFYINLFIECGFKIKKMIELPDIQYKANIINKNFSPFIIIEVY